MRHDPALAPVADKLGRLIPRLASDADGEVVAVARAIQRTLAAQSLDLHDLAAALEPAAPRERSAPQTPADVLDWLLRAPHGYRPTNREIDFLNNLRCNRRFWRGGRLHLSEKQAAWLGAIHAKAQRSWEARHV
jgi:hypothetical protein